MEASNANPRHETAPIKRPGIIRHHATMNDLDDKLDVRYHRGPQPDVYYRCPSSEALPGALQNEIQKSSSSLIPVEIVTEFVFSAGSTITIPVFQQPNLEALGVQPSALPLSITVEHALCRNLEGKDRLKTQRAIARSFIKTIQDIDAYKYCERHAVNKEGTDGSRFKYVCVDSLQNRDRRASIKKKKEGQENGIEDTPKTTTLPTYDCSGAVHIKFSTKRNAINVVYRHNPIHGPSTTRNSDTDGRQLPALKDAPYVPDGVEAPPYTPNDSTPKKKRKRRKKVPVPDLNDYDANGFEVSEGYMPTQPGPSVSTTTKRRKKNASSFSPRIKNAGVQ